MKHFRQLIFVACACLFCASAGCSFSTMLPEQLPGSDPAETPTPSPNLPPADEVALAFLQAWERADFPTMYSLLSPATQQAYPEDLFIAIHDQAYDEATILAVTPRLLASYQPDVHAQVAFSLAYQTEFAGVLDVQNQMELTFVEGRWGVDWSPALIFPQMNDGAQVRLTTQMPSRGNIYDRNGLGLAVQGQLVELGVVPSKIEDETGLLAQLAAALGEEPAEIKARYAALDPNWYVPLGRLSADDARDHFEALSATPGIEMRDAWARAYRPEQIAPHVVGVVGPIPREEAELWRSRGYTGDELVGWMSHTWPVCEAGAWRSWMHRASPWPYWPKRRLGQAATCIRRLTASFKRGSRRFLVSIWVPLSFWKRRPGACWLWLPTLPLIPISSPWESATSSGRTCSVSLMVLSSIAVHKARIRPGACSRSSPWLLEWGRRV
jgi:hypothetical protein